MTTPLFHIATWLTLALTFLFSPLAHAQARSPLDGTRPNVVFILSDDTGWGEIAAMGNPVIRTPHLDRMFRQGVRFMNFHTAPNCAPARAQFMSGRQNYRVGITTNAVKQAYMHLDTITTAQMLKSAGYATAHFGKWNLGDDREAYLPRNRGFDHEILVRDTYQAHFDPVLIRNGTPDQKGTQGYRTDVLFNEAMTWMAQQKDPFFVYLPTFNAHTGLAAPQEDTDLYKDIDLYGPIKNTASGRMPAGGVFYAMQTNMDRNIGRLIEFLEANKLSENTLVLFASDNGHAMGGGGPAGHDTDGFLVEGGLYNAGMRGGKGQLWRGATNVPFIAYWPGKLPAALAIDSVTGGVDLFPTLAALAGANYTHEIDGRSLLPLIEQPDRTSSRRLILRGNSNQYKLAGAHKSNYMVQSDRYRMINGNELYDHLNDPGEQKNVADQYPELMQEFQQAYDQWWEQTRPYMLNAICADPQYRAAWEAKVAKAKKEKKEKGKKDSD